MALGLVKVAQEVGHEARPLQERGAYPRRYRRVEGQQLLQPAAALLEIGARPPEAPEGAAEAQDGLRQSAVQTPAQGAPDIVVLAPQSHYRGGLLGPGQQWQ